MYISTDKIPILAMAASIVWNTEFSTLSIQNMADAKETVKNNTMKKGFVVNKIGTKNPKLEIVNMYFQNTSPTRFIVLYLYIYVV